MAGINRYKLKKFFTIKKICLIVLLIVAVVVNASIKPKITSANRYKKPAKPIDIIATIKSAPTTIPAAIKSAQKTFTAITKSPEKTRKFLDEKIEHGKQNFKDATAALKRR